MAKNKNLIEQYKMLMKEIRNVTPEIYACFALVLSDDYDMDPDEIESLFYKTQVKWNECVLQGENMLQMCFDKTGIDVKAGAENVF